MQLNEVLILDGATGTQLHREGLPAGVCPEEWILEHPEAIRKVQSAYREAGSDAVYAPTFGANRKKLKSRKDCVYETNLELLRLSREAVGNDTLIGGDLSPVGELLMPLGMMSEDELIQIYEEQIRAFYDFGVDFIVIETMMDIREVKCALLAVKRIYGEKKCPVFVTVTLEANGTTLTGTDPLTALLVSQYYGADAFGFNCSSGPDKMIPVIESIAPYASVPLIAKPNAGLPKEENGETVFSMTPAEFKKYVRRLIEHGVSIVGGCCGTNPDFIREISTLKIPVMPPRKKEFPYVSSARKTVLPDEKTKTEVFSLTNETDPEDLYYDILDAVCDYVTVKVLCDLPVLKELLSLLDISAVTPVLFETDNPDFREEIKRNYTGAYCI